MNTDRAVTRYSRVAALLHWVIAVLILANLCGGFIMEGLTGPLRGTIINLHISSGMTVLALTVVRIAWRMTHPPPPFAEGMKSWERHAAGLAHGALYAMMVAMPLTGWALISANPPPGSAGAAALAEVREAAIARGVSGRDLPRAPRTAPRRTWWVLPLPSIGAIERIGSTAAGLGPQAEFHDEMVEWHKIGAFMLIGLLFLHIAAALKHQFLDGYAELARMGIGRR